MSPEVCQLINQVQALSAQLTAAQTALISEIDTRAAASTAVSSVNLDPGRIGALDRLDVASSSRLARADPPAAPPVAARVATSSLGNFGLFNSANYALVGNGQRYASFETTGAAVLLTALNTTAETDVLNITGEAGFCTMLMPTAAHSANHAETTTIRVYIDGVLITTFSSSQASANSFVAVNPLIGSVGGFYTASGIVGTCHDGPPVTFRSSLRVTAQCTVAGYASGGLLHKTWRCS